MNLHLLVIAPIVTAVFILFFKELRQVRMIALLGAGFQLIISVLLLSTFCNERAAGSYTHQLIAMTGTLFLFMYWPSFNAALATGV